MTKIPVLWFRVEEGNTDVAEIRRKLAQIPDHFVVSTHKSDMVTGFYFTDPAWLEPMSEKELLDSGCRLMQTREILDEPEDTTAPYPAL